MPDTTRRRQLAALAAFATVSALPLAACATAPDAPDETLQRLEAASGGRLGLLALDTGSGRRLAHRADERFAMCSTFKWLLAARVLQLEGRGALSLDDFLPVTRADLVPYAPFVEPQLAAGRARIGALAQAMVEISDNAAANLLLARTGGPAALTAWLREGGDALTRLDRVETALNENLPGDPRDSTTPAAMAALMQRLLLTPDASLPAAARERLLGWMVASPTGARRLRAALPAGWRAADKTGTGERGAANDVALVWPPGRAPWVVALYLGGSTRPVRELDGVHRDVMQRVREHFGA